MNKEEKSRIENIIEDSISVKNSIIKNSDLINTINEVSRLLVKMYKSGGKLLLCGNGGSAADAQHLAAEFSGRYYLNRPPLNAEALHVNSSFLTAASNDFGFEKAYARMVDALGEKGDILIAISTSGNSPNIIEAVNAAKSNNMTVVGLTGNNGGKIKDICDVIINVPSDDTPRIQESHILIGHILCEIVEKELFENC